MIFNNTKKPTKACKPINKTLVFCTDTNSKCKGTVVSKNEQQLVVDLPSGFTMTLHRLKGHKLYSFRVGTLEFVSDGWQTT